GNWAGEVERKTAESAIVQAERMVYKLWRQFFVGGAYYSGLLSSQYRVPIRLENLTLEGIAADTIPALTGIAIGGEHAHGYRERWKLWCTAMRFVNFGERVHLVKSLSPSDGQVHARHESVSLRSVIIQAMVDDSSSPPPIKDIPTKDIAINDMW